MRGVDVNTIDAVARSHRLHRLAIGWRGYAIAIAILMIGAGAASIPLAAQEPRQLAAGYAVTLRLPPEGLVASEENEIEFKLEDVRDAQGPRPVRFARLRVVVDMPSMPTMGKFDEIAHQEGVPGEYGAHPTFAHGGEYRLTLTLLPPEQQLPTMSPQAATSFSTEFVLQVADAPAPGARRAAVKRFGLKANPTVPLQAGVPADLDLSVVNHFMPVFLPEGGFRVGDGPVPAFDVVHEKLLHLFVVRDDLGAFAHEHPELTGPGTFRLRFTFPTAGRYRLFADVAPQNAGSQILLDEIVVPGAPPSRYDLAGAAAAQPSAIHKVDGIEIDWQWPQPLASGRSVIVSARLRTAAGGAVTDLEPYLGARGHLMLVHEDGTTFVHGHPDEREPAAPGATVVPFLIRLPKPGLYRAWGQFQRGGRLLTADFIVRAGE